ncbi:MAG: neutral/alkaline non-lysosomal ceramidase N-terminal domain-containing protein [Planctomycetota bacterium]
MRLLVGIAVVLVALSTGCTGIFQRTVPEEAARFERVSHGAELRVGAAEADITPKGEQYLGGFDMDRVSTGVHSKLKARALVLELGGLRVAVVGVDNLGLERDDVEWIKNGLVGFQNGCVFLCSSHTHAAPDLVGMWGFYMLTSGRDRDYLVRVRDGIAAAVATAADRLRPAVLVRGEARLPPRGLVRNSNRRGLFDPRLTVIQAKDAASGAPLGALLHMACHPEVMRRRNSAISADFVGALCDRWQAAGLGQPVFVNGALGAMITPEPKGAEGMEVMGEGLFEVAQRALEDAGPVPVESVELRRQDLYLPLTSPGLTVGRLMGAIPRDAYEGLMRSSVGYLRIGTIEAACVPGEMEPTLAARLRRASGKPDLLLFGLCDDEVGYLLREVDARDREFAYERTMSPVVDAGERVFAALCGVSVTASR